MRYAVLIGRATRGGHYRHCFKKDRKYWECPDLIRYGNLGDALIDWVLLPPNNAGIRGIYDDGVCLPEDVSPHSYACVEINPTGIEATGWMAKVIFGANRTYGYNETNGTPIEEIAAKLLTHGECLASEDDGSGPWQSSEDEI